MTETNAEFVKLIGPGLAQLNADGARLARLAARGAAVQWRPISEWTPNHDYICPYGYRWHWEAEAHYKNPRPFWAAALIASDWSRANQPSYGIPIEALGAPEGESNG